MKPEDLISDKYRKILEEYHENTGSWGRNAGKKRVPFIDGIVEKHDTTDILDYGAGKASLNLALAKKDPKEERTPFKISSYEPGIPKYAGMPEPHDIVVSFGALEHVEPDHIDNVLSHIRSLTKIIAYLDIGTTSAKHILPDGRNAHLIVENKIWWIERLEKAGFKVCSSRPNFKEDGDHLIKLDPNMGKGCIMFVCEPI